MPQPNNPLTRSDFDRMQECAKDALNAFTEAQLQSHAFCYAADVPRLIALAKELAGEVVAYAQVSESTDDSHYAAWNRAAGLICSCGCHERSLADPCYDCDCWGME
jgi:hypothetical protein